MALQASQPAQPPSRFRSSVDLVQVDVSAVDRSGQPVRDLTAADFDVRVDGRPRPIVSAQFVSVPAASAAPADDLPDVSSNIVARGGRLVMIVIDRSSITTGRGRSAIEAASRFVRDLNRADRVALATIPDGPRVDFTADHSLVAAMLKEIDGTAVPSLGQRNIGIAEALAFERRDVSTIEAINDRECGTLSTGGRGGGGSDLLICLNEVRAEAGHVSADARDRARRSIAGLRALIESLPPSQGPKLMVFVSEGLVVDRETGQLSWLEAKAAAAHVTLYALHVQPSDFDPSHRRPQAAPAADRAVQERGLAMVAEATRGDLFRVVSNSDFAFQRLSAELSGYYLLGFEAEAGDRDGRPHAISVAVRRRGVTVRARRQFVAAPERSVTTEAQVVATLRDPMPATDIPLALGTYSFLDRDGKQQLLIAAEIDRRINPGSELAVGYIVVDFDGQLVTSRMDTLPPHAGAPGPGRYFSTARVDPDRYTVKLVVVDDAGRRGSVERVADTRPRKAGPFRTTGLVLADGRNGGNAAIAPAISGRIASGTLHAYVELMADTREALDEASVTVEIARTEEGDALRRVPAPLEPVPGFTLGRMANVNVDVSWLPPGDYVARAEIALGLDRVGQIRRRFRIGAPPGVP